MNDIKIVRLNLCNIERYTDNEEDEIFRWTILDKRNNNIGEFEFKRDEKDRLWLNSCDISTQRKGIGTAVIKYAVKVFEAVYFCVTPKEELIGAGRGYDCCYLTEEGVIFMKSCLRKKIIKPEWTIKL